MKTARLPDAAGVLAVLILASILQGGISGFTLSFFPLLMEYAGHSAKEIGLANSAQMGAILAVTLSLPFFLPRLPLPRLYISACLTGALCMLALASSAGSLFLHVILRFAMGACISILYVVAEYWINARVEGRHRGKVLGCYGMSIVIGMGAGPLLASQTGTASLIPFLLVAVWFAGCAVIAYLARHLAPAGHIGSDRPTGNPLRFLRLTPALAAAGLLHGVVESAMYAFLPLYGIRSGLTESQATGLLTSIFWGAIGMQLLLGWLADRWHAPYTLTLAATVNAAGAVFLALMLELQGPLLWLYMLLWGGTIPTVYTLASTCVGHRYHGEALAHAILAFILMYGLGSLIGPNLAGAIIEHVTPHGLPVVMAFAYGLCALFILYYRPHKKA